MESRDMLPLSWYPREMEAWRAFEEGDAPSYARAPRWPYPAMRRRSAGKRTDWVPALDILERSDGYSVRAELPGVSAADIDISVAGESLTISGTRRPPEGETELDYQCSEICYGDFQRTISLPGDADPERIEASFADGVLEITVPKLSELKPRKITVTLKE